MIIDVILDRRFRESSYNATEFYDYVCNWCTDDQPEDCIFFIIKDALESGKERLVKLALTTYVEVQGYNPEICEYINSVKWLKNNNLK